MGPAAEDIDALPPDVATMARNNNGNYNRERLNDLMAKPLQLAR